MEFQSQSNYLRRLKEKGININEKTLLVGLRGPGNLDPCLTAKEVKEWALNGYLEGDNRMEDLALSDTENTFDICEKLFFLSKDKNLNREEQKWAFMLLEDILKKNSGDSMQGLCELNSFWAKLGYPPYRPPIFQGIDIKLEPQNYYTLSNYKEILDKHYKWLQDIKVVMD